jgi:hypothetical protein
MKKNQAKAVAFNSEFAIALLLTGMLLATMPLTLRYAMSNPQQAAAMFAPAGSDLLHSPGN